ncbi:putative 5-hydroxytryptamine receptor 7 [Hypsibius exemplaris]|uniref:5-hydroxytryptamine receptor 7 n=1 Tax=Hypsibius exemplaris TaxID=2072580 RepID=A0A1W0WHI8_HYPEX|nr:putative 5-hydroxytryptamine receptor 7 [Hypsibius exemplaris]
MNLCVISLDRYFVISRPLRYGPKRTTRRMALSVVGVWALSTVISVPPLFYFGNQTTGHQCVVSQEPYYQIYATITAFYAPVILMIIAYGKIYQAARRISEDDKHFMFIQPIRRLSEKKPPPARAEEVVTRLLIPGISVTQPLLKSKPSPTTSSSVDYKRTNSSYYSRELKAFRTLTAIAVAFLVSWLPFFILALIRPFYADIPKWATAVALWLGYFNSTVNPALYSIFNKDFRRPFAELLRCRCWTLRKTIRAESYEAQFVKVAIVIAASFPVATSDLCVMSERSRSDLLRLNSNNISIRPPWRLRIHGQDPYIFRQYSATSECYGGLYVDILELLIRTSDIHLDVVSLANVGNESLGVVLVKELQSGQTKLGLDNPVMTKERIEQYAIAASHQTASLTIVVHKNKFIRLGRSTTSRLFGSLKPFSVNVWILSMSSLALWALHCAVKETLNLLQQREWDDRQVFSQIFQRLPRSGFGIFGTSLGQLNYFNGNSTSQLIGSWIFFSCVLTLFALFGGQLTMVFSNNEPQPPFSTLDEFIDSKFRLLAFESSTLRSIQTNRESRYRKLSMKIDALNNSGGNNATSDFEGTAFRRAATENYAVLINSMRIPQLAAMADFPLRVAVPEFFTLPVGMILMNKNDSDRGILDQKPD